MGKKIVIPLTFLFKEIICDKYFPLQHIHKNRKTCDNCLKNSTEKKKCLNVIFKTLEEKTPNDFIYAPTENAIDHNKYYDVLKKASLYTYDSLTMK